MRLRGAPRGSQRLKCGAICEGRGTDPRRHLVGSTQLRAGIQPPALAAQPFVTEEMGASELHANTGATETTDRLEIEALGGIAVAQARPRARLDPQRPVGAAGVCHRREPMERIRRALGLPAAESGHDQLTEAPVGVDQRRGFGRLAGERVRGAECVEGERKLREGAGLAGELQASRVAALPHVDRAGGGRRLARDNYTARARGTRAAR